MRTQLGLCSTSFSMYCGTQGGVQEWDGCFHCTLIYNSVKLDLVYYTSANLQRTDQYNIYYFLFLDGLGLFSGSPVEIIICDAQLPFVNCLLHLAPDHGESNVVKNKINNHCTLDKKPSSLFAFGLTIGRKSTSPVAF